MTSPTRIRDLVATAALGVAAIAVSVATAGCGEPQRPTASSPATMPLPALAASAGDEGRARAVDTRACDPAGKSIAVLERDAQGRPNRWRYFAVVRRGHRHVRVLTCEAADRNGDGKVDARYFYDAGGRLVLEQRDMDFDGRAEFVADYSQFPTHRSLVRAHDLN